MEGVWAGLVGVFDMRRTNLHDGPLTFGRKSGSADNTNDNNDDNNDSTVKTAGTIISPIRLAEYDALVPNLTYGSCKGALHPVVSIHTRMQFRLSSERPSSYQCPIVTHSLT